ncbi:jg22659 [Pararge aegeria aegeria]|uniref:Jg22659 protein n=1 Tax=Pararge aegeria aegeria TaxID=348720 RepID=A0A8S4R761_9NEOP|nr:jg22659 [Pararge aegeria aegeria]
MSIISFHRWKPTLFIPLHTRQTGVDLTVPPKRPNMADARVGSGNTRISTSQKDRTIQAHVQKRDRRQDPGRLERDNDIGFDKRVKG